MAKAQYAHRGETLDYANTGDIAIEAFEIIDFGSGIGVAGTIIPPGATGSLHVIGVYAIPKAAGAVEFGEALFYDGAAGTVSTDDGGTPCGYAAAAAEDSEPTVWVRIG